MSTPRTGWRIPPAERRRIAEEVKLYSTRQVAGRHGIDPQTVSNIRAEFGIPARQRGSVKNWPGVPCVKARKVSWPFRPRPPAPLHWAASFHA